MPRPILYFGCDYYPEQWAQWLEEGEARWETDARLMAEAGFNVVRLAEFAWGLMEPEPDRFDFAWLERAIDVLARHDLQIVLCTPTPTPPPWLLAAHPDITQVTADGRRYGPGTRREACANHPVYQERSRIISQAIADRFARHPAVIGWQTDNEFGCHDTARCYCEHCTAAFQRWLAARYGDLPTLNAAWGTAFWGEGYYEWTQIPVPSNSAAERSPSHLLDFYRFSSDSWRDYHEMQIAILRRTCPGHFVNHNLMGFFPQLNYYDLCRKLDFVTWDNYHHHGATPATIAAAHDHMWGVMERNFWVMEQQVGQVNWSAYNPATPPNFVRLKTYQAIGHGADGIVYFRWRQALAGSEQYHSGLLDNAGRPTAGYAEAKAIGQELRRLESALEATRPRPEVAILLDYDSRWTLEAQPHNKRLRYDVADDYTLRNPALTVDPDAHHETQYMTGRAYLGWPYVAPYVALWERNVPVAIVAPESDLSRYKVVCAPFLNVLRPEVIKNLAAYVAGGGTLVLGPRTGFKDESSRLFPTPQPGPLAELTGATVAFFDSLEPERIDVLRWESLPGAHRTEVGLWAEVLDPGPAETVAVYTHGWYAGRPAITSLSHPSGGEVVYVGCMGGPALYENLFDLLFRKLGIRPLIPSMPGVEVCARYGEDGRRVLFLINHTAQAQQFSLASPVRDLITDTEFPMTFRLQPGQVAVFEDGGGFGEALTGH
jgi:beta-galactosidase